MGRKRSRDLLRLVHLSEMLGTLAWMGSSGEVGLRRPNNSIHAQLKQLLLRDVLNLNNLFTLGSIIIITTTNRNVLQLGLSRIYHVEKLNAHDSLHLFSCHSFRRRNLPEDRRYDSITAVRYCKGNPLSLKLLGRTLFRKKKSYCQSFLEGLRNPKPREIHDVLRRIYDMLGRDEKQIFLDIACFFRRNYSKPSLIKMLECSYNSAYTTVEYLIDKSILE
ncbi:Protein DA1-related 4 [Linum perenne]